MQVQHTTDYNKFKMIKENRRIRPKTVEELVADPTFENTFKYKPIIVDEEYGIIDGQHRFLAAKQRKIPIWYIVQPGASLEHIQKYNVQQKQWTQAEFSRFYELQGNPHYKLLNWIASEYNWSVGTVLYAVYAFEDVSRDEIARDFKNGKLVITEVDRLKDFFSLLSVGFERLRKNQKLPSYIHLKSKYYVAAYAMIFNESRERLRILANKLHLVFNSLPMTNKILEAKEFLEKAVMKRVRVGAAERMDD